MWGTASDGQTWGGDANALANFSVNGNTGLVTKTNGNSYSAVLGPATTDQEATLTGALSTFANANVGDVLRWTDTNNWYKAYLDGTNLVIQRTRQRHRHHPRDHPLRRPAVGRLPHPLPRRRHHPHRQHLARDHPRTHRLDAHHHRLVPPRRTRRTPPQHPRRHPHHHLLPSRHTVNAVARTAPVRSAVTLVCTVVCGVVLVACSGASSSDAAGPRLVTPTTLGGSSGIGPRTIEGAAASVGARAGSSRAVLSDRVLTVATSAHRRSSRSGFTVVAVAVIVENRTAGPISNDAASFRLTGPSGDVFAVRAPSDPLFDPVGAGATEHGTVEFEVPDASTSRLSLMYRSDDGADAVVVPLAT